MCSIFEFLEKTIIVTLWKKFKNGLDLLNLKKWQLKFFDSLDSKIWLIKSVFWKFENFDLIFRGSIN